MGKRTALYEWHLRAGARMVDFAGWEMPLHYGSQLEEHHLVRRSVAMFDVSHMTVLDLSGARTRPLLRYLLANDVGKLVKGGDALYSCLLNETGGVLDDLIVYALAEDGFRLVLNAATRSKDLAWVARHALPFDVKITERTDLALIAVQGPLAQEHVARVLDAKLRERVIQLPPFHAAWQGEIFVARTGYTGEDGFEILLPNEQATILVQTLLSHGVRPAGLGARDTLRLEAGLNLYRADMDEFVTPLESGLAWTVAWLPETRDFIGRQALELQKRHGIPRQRVGLLLEGGGVMRRRQRVVTPIGDDGEVTSGGFSPTLKRAIALARISATMLPTQVAVEIRGGWQPARLVKPPFVRHGKPCVEVTG